MDLRIFSEPQQGATYDQLLAAARATEDGGFDAFFRSDHYLRIGPGDAGPGPTDAWITLAGLARDTSRIRLGTLVSSATFRYPGVLAISVAQVDAMSGGRVELGLGTGWYEQEHKSYGIDFPSLGERFERFEEQLQIVLGLWGAPSGDRFSFDGRHYQLADSPALPKPAQKPHPPVIIGGRGPKRTARLTATYADEFNVPPSPHQPADARAMYEGVWGACERQGRDPASLKLSAAKVVCCGESEQELERRAAAIGRPLATLRGQGLTGSPQEVVDQLAAYAEVGADRMYLQVFDLDDLDHIALLAAEVRPAADAIRPAAG